MSSCQWKPGFVAVVLAACALSIASAQGTPPNPFPVWILQPDGKTRFLARTKADRHHTWKVTIDGYTVIRNKKHCVGREENSCWWEYALRGPNGELVPSGVVVTEHGNINNIPQQLRPPQGLRPAPEAPQS